VETVHVQRKCKEKGKAAVMMNQQEERERERENLIKANVKLVFQK
jgi:hypothetical protein